MTEHLLAIDDLASELPDLLTWASVFKGDDDFAPDFTPLSDMSIGCIYEKPSTRTRVSFEVGIHRLGGHPLYLSPTDLQLGRGETIEDTAGVLSRYLDGMTYRCFGHDTVEALAAGADVPVINALSDLHHPCQAAADLLTLEEINSGLKETRVAWVGDGNNVLHDLMLACAAVGVDCAWATPEGFGPDAGVVARAEALAEESGATLLATTEPEAAVDEATAVYTDVFLSMGEEDQADKLAAFDGFQVTLDLLEHADDDWAFMHCLPAHRGEEVAAEVIDHDQSIVFDQAENRLHAQVALLTRLMAPMAYETYGGLHGF